MSMAPYDYGIETFYTSNSTEALFRSCARKLEFAKFFPSRRRDDSHAGEVGNSLHAGYQNYLIHRDYDQAMFEMMRTYPFHLQEQDRKKERTIFACYATMDELIRSKVLDGYEIAQIKKANGEVVPAVEVAFEILLEGVSLSAKKHIPVIYRGKIDLILYHPFTGKYAVYDIKTTRRHIEDKASYYFFDEQVLPYALVLERLLGKEIGSLEVNYLSVYIDVKKPIVENYPFTKNLKDVEDWARGLILDLELQKIYYDMNWFKRNPNSCSNSYGKVCSYFEDICNLRDPAEIKLMLTMGKELEIKEDYFGEPWVKMSIKMQEAA